MKARREDDGQIKFYNELPSLWLGVTGNYVGGFNLIDEETQRKEGFFDVEEPVFNRTLEVLSPIYFNEEKEVFTYDVLPKPNLPTLEQAKIEKISELKLRGREKFSETDWYYTRELRMKDLGISKSIPAEVLKQNEDLYNLLDEKEAFINSINDLEQVLNFDTSLEIATPVVVEESTPDNVEVALTPDEILEKAKSLEASLKSENYTDYSAVSLALSLPEGTDDEKIAKAEALNTAIKNLISVNGEPDLSLYEVTLSAVKKEDYTDESWTVYQSVLDANVVTSINSQQEIDIAVSNIKDAQNKLTLRTEDSNPPSSGGSGTSDDLVEPVTPVENTVPPVGDNPLPKETPDNPKPQDPIVDTQIKPAEEPTSTPDIVAS